MRNNCCRGCLAFLLKFLNFLQAFVGVSIAIYAVWVLNHWIRNGGTVDLSDLTNLWFVCALMGSGVLICLIVLTGYVAAEIRSSCFLCFYTTLITMLILVESALAGGIIYEKNWEQYLPLDSTGEFKTLISFIRDNVDIFKWVALSFVVIQALSLFLSLCLRAVIPRRRADYDSDDEDFVVIRRPLLIPQVAPSSDIWSSRMRQKYGLNQGEYAYNPAYNSVDPKV